MITTRLSRPLLEFFDDYCKRHELNCPLGCRLEVPSSRLAMTLIADDAEGRECSQRDAKCHQCTLLTTLRAIDRLVPADRHRDWIRQPRAELAGRTPLECIETGDYDVLIDSLWLMDQSEWTCG